MAAYSGGSNFNGSEGVDASALTVTNVDPTATLGNNGPISEGSSATITFTGPVDPSSADTVAGFRYAFSCTNGDLSGATYAGSGTSASTACPFADNGSYLVKGRIFDKDGGYTESTTTVTVTNVAPTITSITGPLAPTALGAAISITAQFIDPGTLDTHTTLIDWGNGISSAGTVNPVTRTVTASYTYPATGVYMVTVKVTDKDGGFHTAKITDFTTYVVIYDPNGGFVTGGGWFNSPAGACQLTTACTKCDRQGQLRLRLEVRERQDRSDGEHRVPIPGR